QAVPALAAAQVEDVAVRLDGCGRDDEIHLAAGVLQVLDHVAVSLDVERVEELAPPLLGEVRLQVGDRAEARSRSQAPRTLRLGGSDNHVGQLSSRCRPPRPRVATGSSRTRRAVYWVRGETSCAQWSDP